MTPEESRKALLKVFRMFQALGLLIALSLLALGALVVGTVITQWDSMPWFELDKDDGWPGGKITLILCAAGLVGAGIHMAKEMFSVKVNRKRNVS
jgi:hypothetical protein